MKNINSESRDPKQVSAVDDSTRPYESRDSSRINSVMHYLLEEIIRRLIVRKLNRSSEFLPLRAIARSRLEAV